MDTADVLKGKLEAAGITATELARTANLNERSVRNYVNGSRSPDKATMTRINQALAVHVGSLSPDDPASTTMVSFLQRSPLAQSQEFDAVRDYLADTLDDQRLLDMGLSVGDWRGVEVLMVCMRDAIAAVQTSRGLVDAVRLERQAEAVRAHVIKRKP